MDKQKNIDRNNFGFVGFYRFSWDLFIAYCKSTLNTTTIAFMSYLVSLGHSVVPQ
jgi:hypothetical protein